MEDLSTGPYKNGHNWQIHTLHHLGVGPSNLQHSVNIIQRQKVKEQYKNKYCVLKWPDNGMHESKHVGNLLMYHSLCINKKIAAFKMDILL